MTSAVNLPKLLQPALKALEKDLLVRAKTERVEAGLKKAWEDEQKAGQTGMGFDPWRRERVTQLAVAWILSVVFVRTLEDRGYVDPRVAGATADALRAAEDREALFLQVAPFLGPREYLLAVFRSERTFCSSATSLGTRCTPTTGKGSSGSPAMRPWPGGRVPPDPPRRRPVPVHAEEGARLRPHRRSPRPQARRPHAACTACT